MKINFYTIDTYGRQIELQFVAIFFENNLCI